MVLKPEDLVVAEILSDKTGRYRRNLNVLSAVAIALYFIPGADISDASIFNINLAKAGSRGLWANGILLLLLIYNFAMFIFYIRRDFRVWKEDALLSSQFTELRMYFNFPPSEKYVRKLHNFSHEEIITIKQCEYSERFLNERRTPQKTEVSMKCNFVRGANDRGHRLDRAVDGTLFNRAKRKLTEFFTIDLALPVSVGLFAISFTIVSAYDAARLTAN